MTDKWQTQPLVRDGAPYGQDTNFQTRRNVWSWAPVGSRHQDRQTHWPSVAMWLWLWLGTACKAETSSVKNISMRALEGKNMSLGWVKSCIHRKIPLIIAIKIGLWDHNDVCVCLDFWMPEPVFLKIIIVTDLINALPRNSSVNTVQHATIEEAVFSVDPTDAPINWLDSDQVICVYYRSMSVPRLYN
jgi:hypothetical protein